MTATTTGERRRKPPKETYRDWLIEDNVDESIISTELDPSSMITRDQLVKEANDWTYVTHGIVPPITIDDVELWEYRGIVPRPIRQWHDGAVRALYPRFALLLVRNIRKYQHRDESGKARTDKRSLSEIAPIIRAFVRNIYSNAPIDQEIKKNSMNRGATPQDLYLPDELESGAIRLAMWHRRITGIPTERVEVVVVDENGRRSTYDIQIAIPQKTEHELAMEKLSDDLHQLRVQHIDQ